MKVSSDISVYITTYNMADYISECLNSVLDQSLRPFEIIVIDDCSTDETIKIIKDYQRRSAVKIRLIQNPLNKGIAFNRNLAIETAKGTVLCGIDGDDYWKNNKLAEEYALLIETGADYVFSDHEVITNDGGRSNEGKGVLSWPMGQDLHQEILYRQMGPMLFRSEMVRLSALKDLGGYDEDLEIFEDYDLKIRLSERYSGRGIPRVLHAYRSNPQGLSKKNKTKHLKALHHILSKYAQSGILRDTKKFSRYRTNTMDAHVLGALANKEINVSGAARLLRDHNGGNWNTWWILLKHSFKTAL